jgi:hypothetical protein
MSKKLNPTKTGVDFQQVVRPAPCTGRTVIIINSVELNILLGEEMIRPEHQLRFEEALASKAPFESLCRLAEALRDEGISQIEVYFLFGSYQQKIPDDDPLHDAIVDTMDEIHGGPWAKGGGFFPSALTDEVIQAERKKT